MHSLNENAIQIGNQSRTSLYSTYAWTLGKVNLHLDGLMSKPGGLRCLMVCPNPSWIRVQCKSLNTTLVLQSSKIIKFIEKKKSVESQQSHCIHTQFHWSSGPPICFLLWGTRVQSPGGYLCVTGILLLVLSRYKSNVYETVGVF